MKKILDSIKNQGFCEYTFVPDRSFKNFAHYICNISLSDEVLKNESKGYSNELLNVIDEDKRSYLERFGKNFFLNHKWWLKKLLISPRLLSIDVYRTEYDDQAANNPTHAMLWHRDLDDQFPHVKVFFPLNKINLNNGAFCYAEKQICKLNEKLVDINLIKKLKNINDPYIAKDSIRVTNETFLKYFEKKVKIFEGDVGSALFIDTNNCYHRGGQILKKNLERNMMVLNFGGITHKFNDFSNYSNFDKFKVYVYNKLKRIQFRITGEIHSKKIFLS